MRTLLTVAVLLILLVQARLWFGPNGLRNVRDLSTQVHALKDENKRLLERNAALAAEVHDLKTGLEAVEERARTDLGLVKEGEVFVRIPAEASRPASRE